MPIEINNLHLAIGGSILFEDFSLSIAGSQRIGITGPSGCGKTTLLRSIVNGHPPEGSSFEVFDVGQEAIGYAPQVGGLFPWFDVQRNLQFFFDKRHSPHSVNPTIEDMTRDFGLGKCVHNFPSQLSGGEYQRSILACATITTPSVFIIDEPLTGVDYRMKWQVLEAVSAQIHRRRATMVLVSHDVEILSYLCDRVITLSGKPARRAEEFVFPGGHPRRRLDITEGVLRDVREQLLHWLLENRGG